MSGIFKGPWFNAFNNGLGITYIHLLGKFVEFALIEGPMIDPYHAQGRGRIISALDLSINSRMIGYGQVGVDQPTSNPKEKGATASSNGPDGSVKVKGQATPGNRERWLPYVSRGRTRLRATIRHFTHAYVHFVVLETLVTLIRHFGSDTIGNPTGHPHAMASFLTKSFVLFPDLLLIPVPRMLIEMVCEFSIAAGVWQGISWGYHTLAFLTVGSGLWEVESWEVDLFDAPWKADSMMDLWGRRWHQLFRVGPLHTCPYPSKSLSITSSSRPPSSSEL